jgi:hypothetical protein
MGVLALMLLAGQALAQDNPIPPARPDIDGDGNTDFVFTRTGDGSSEVWLMDGLGRDGLPVVPEPAHPVDSNWRVACVADLNAEGTPEIIWRSVDSGRMVHWRMQWSSATRQYTRILGDYLTASENNDQQNIVENLQWRLASCADVGSMPSGPGSTPNPEPDGRIDLIWQNTVTGQMRYMYFVNFNETNSITPTPAGPVDANWRLAGVRDFGKYDATTQTVSPTPDNRPDLIFQNTTSKKMVVWFMDGPLRQQGFFTNPSVPADLNWDLTGTGDMGTDIINPARDGNADLIFRNATSQKLVVWFMEGINRKLTNGGGFTSPDTQTDPLMVLVEPH